MSRDELIEKVESLITYSPFGASERDDAERVPDAILPQVTTVEELANLMTRVAQSGSAAAVLDQNRRIWTLFENDRGDWYAMRLGDQDEGLAVAVLLDFEDSYDPELDESNWMWELLPPLTVVVQP